MMTPWCFVAVDQRWEFRQREGWLLLRLSSFELEVICKKINKEVVAVCRGLFALLREAEQVRVFE